MNQSEDNSTYSMDYSYYYHGLSGLFSFNFFISLPANIYVVRQIAGGGDGAMASEFFALNLSIAQLLFSILSIVYILLNNLRRMDLTVGYLLVVIFELMLVSPTIFQGWISLERYMAVVHPTIFLRFKPLSYRLACCIVTWLLVILDCSITVSVLSPMGTTYMFIFKAAFFLVIMLYFGVHALCVLKQPGPGDRGRERESQNSMKRKAFKVIMITQGFSILTLSLQVFVLAPTLLYATTHVIIKVLLASLLISIISGFIPPLLYLHRAGKLPCIKF
ncbi:P2Y purinoceptor 8 [Labrus bergylta]|uniref:P2Y purinoceptor 8 n=1 Tax=Labrus bergylta TaxID=56723 RepID=UPI0010FB3D07|nr:P2Y purinoceptor 8-like [Labrus bergylta]